MSNSCLLKSYNVPLFQFGSLGPFGIFNAFERVRLRISIEQKRATEISYTRTIYELRPLSYTDKHSDLDTDCLEIALYCAAMKKIQKLTCKIIHAKIDRIKFLKISNLQRK